MTATVDEVITMRGPDSPGLNRMLSLSLAVHVIVFGALFLVPRDWMSKPKTTPVLMSISLNSGPSGDKTGGMNPAPARPIEEVKPEPKRPEPIRPSQPKSDVMPLPSKTPPKTPPKPMEKPPAPIARPPSTGLEIRQGTSRAETGLDPSDEAFTREYRPVVNLGMGAVSIGQMRDLLIHANATSTVRWAIVGLDMESFLDDGRPDFDVAALSGNAESEPERLVRLRLDIARQTLAAAFERWSSHDAAVRSDVGERPRPSFPRAWSA